MKAFLLTRFDAGKTSGRKTHKMTAPIWNTSAPSPEKKNGKQQQQKQTKKKNNSIAFGISIVQTIWLRPNCEPALRGERNKSLLAG
jgi:hypothetical protein